MAEYSRSFDLEVKEVYSAMQALVRKCAFGTESRRRPLPVSYRLQCISPLALIPPARCILGHRVHPFSGAARG